MPKPLAVFTTIQELAAAKSLARSAVELRLAACVHIEEVQSVFRWDEAVQNETEYRLLFKSTDEAYDALAEHIVAEHPYDQPALWSLEMGKGDQGFFNWIAAETSD